jgi:predicted esterase
MSSWRRTPRRLAWVLSLAALAPGPGTAAGPARDRLVLKTASGHPIRYYLSLPPAYRPGRRWPVLVCADCAGSNFRSLAEHFRKERGRLPCLLVVPCTFSNTNAITGAMRAKYRRLYPDDLIDHVRGPSCADLDWDEAGLLAILRDLHRDYDTEERFYITGFSGGGLLAYRMIFKHPDLLAGAAPECANFFHPEYRSLKGRFSPADLNFPVHLIQGEEDHNRASTKASQFFSTPLQELGLTTIAGVLAGGLLGWWTGRWWPVGIVAVLTLGVLAGFIGLRRTGLDAQTDTAAELLRYLGYPNVKRTLVSGMGHEGRPGPVFDTFRPYWRKEKKRSDPLD